MVKSGACFVLKRLSFYSSECPVTCSVAQAGLVVLPQHHCHRPAKEYGLCDAIIPPGIVRFIPALLKRGVKQDFMAHIDSGRQTVTNRLSPGWPLHSCFTGAQPQLFTVLPILLLTYESEAEYWKRCSGNRK